jgi:hypothetical protein
MKEEKKRMEERMARKKEKKNLLGYQRGLKTKRKHNKPARATDDGYVAWLCVFGAALLSEIFLFFFDTNFSFWFRLLA